MLKFKTINYERYFVNSPHPFQDNVRRHSIFFDYSISVASVVVVVRVHQDFVKSRQALRSPHFSTRPKISKALDGMLIRYVEIHDAIPPHC